MKKRLIATLLISCYSLSMVANALIVPTYSTTYEIGTGTTYTHVVGTDNSTLQRANIIEYTPNTNVTPMIVYKDDIYGGKTTITEAAAYLEEQGYNVIGGINGDFYDLSTGVPSGIVIDNGVIVSSDAWYQAVGFKADGTAIIEKPLVNMQLICNGVSTTISYYNKVRTTAGAYLLDEYFNDNTLSISQGTDIVLKRLDDTPITAISSAQLEVVDIYSTSSPTTIEPGYLVLTIRDEISHLVPDVAIGDIVTLTTNVNNTGWNDVVYAVGANQSLIENGAIVSGLGTTRDPRSAIGVKADGTVVVYEVDGRQTSYSNGLSLQTVAEELLALGCVTAVNLDGGGSSSVIASLPGYDDYTVVNSPSSGSLRSNANYIMFVNNEEPTGVLDSLHIYPENYLMLLGASVGLDVLGTDENYYSVDVDLSDINLSASGGTIENNIFTAVYTGTATINASLYGMSTSKDITVLTTIDSINVYSDSGQSISELSLEPFEVVSLNPKGSYKYLDVASSNTSFKYDVIGDIGTIDENGVFTAGELKGEGSILISYGNYSSVTIPVGVGLTKDSENTVIFDDENIFTSEDVALTTDNVTVSNGESSLKAEFTNGGTIDTKIAISDIANYLSFKAKGDISELYVMFEAEDGDTIRGFTNITDDFESYNVEIPENAVYFTGFKVNDATGTIYLDNIMLTELENDNSYPEIAVATDLSNTVTSLNISGTITKNQNIAVSEDNVSFYLNGNEVSADYSSFNGEFTLTSNNLFAGLNRLTIKAYDNFGNLTIASYDVYTDESDTVKYQDIETHWAKPYINYVDQKGIVTGVVTDDLYYFNPTVNITRAEFAIMISRYLGLDTSEIDEYLNPSPVLDEEGNPLTVIDDEGNEIAVISEVEPIEMIEFADYDSIPSWALSHVIAVSNASIMNGALNGDGTVSFNATNTITRAEVITVLGRIADTGVEQKEMNFTDSASISSWSYEYFQRLYNLGVINGYTDGTILPLNNITRAEVSKLLFSIM